MRQADFVAPFPRTTKTCEQTVRELNDQRTVWLHFGRQGGEDS
jgi:hypothetical protein